MPTRVMAAGAVGINYWRDVAGKSWSGRSPVRLLRRLEFRGTPEENASPKYDE
jgi:hypothetical protein